ncbi:HTH-type transcriptional regulator CymR [Caloramator mitchellensis]|uniref:HTH-type transcriptional regulator CymR n=1 Tax=Caloramator mitchellensis TaxID=908809 RepID=A0A0R3K1W8_CALMK|nr:Rrf2 family transcriptional regulator [Caloramator mitchellensis]KRQ86882.1 HTH-type transcriptional regulator CymR [Caloramator mitchellensis]
MKLSTRGRYGVKAMFELAKSYGGAPVSIKEISERQNISEYYLEQLFSSLRKAGLVKSIRGAQGGYVLSREPKDITIKEIFNVLEGPIELSECITEEMNCSRIDYCATRLLWLKINNSINEVLNSTTLQDVVNDYNTLQNFRVKGE